MLPSHHDFVWISIAPLHAAWRVIFVLLQAKNYLPPITDAFVHLQLMVDGLWAQHPCPPKPPHPQNDVPSFPLTHYGEISYTPPHLKQVLSAN